MLVFVEDGDDFLTTPLEELYNLDDMMCHVQACSASLGSHESHHVLLPVALQDPSYCHTPATAHALSLSCPTLLPDHGIGSFQTTTDDVPAVSSFPEFVKGTTPFLLPQASYFVGQPPPVVYQASTVESGRVHMIIQLAAPAAAALTACKGVLTSALHLAVRRFDLRKLSVYNEDEGRMVAVTLPSTALEAATLSANGILHVHVKCKFMPVSTAFGEAPLVYAILIKPVDELVVSAPFAVRSKVPKVAAPRPLPKVCDVLLMFTAVFVEHVLIAVCVPLTALSATKAEAQVPVAKP